MSDYGLMFHHFYDVQHPMGQGAINAEEFEKILDFVGCENIIDPLDWLTRVKTDTLSGKDLCITFDDNLRCQYDIAVPVMEKLDLKAFWFVYTSPFTGADQRLEVYKYFRDAYFDSINDFYNKFFEKTRVFSFSQAVEKHRKNFVPKKYLKEFPFYTDLDRLFRSVRDVVLGEAAYFDVMDAMLDEFDIDVKEVTAGLFMEEQQIRDLHNKGHVIGLHSHSHPTRIENLSHQEQLNEYKQNYNILADITGEKLRVMSHPCNSYNNDTLKVLHDLGIETGFRSNMAVVKNRGELELPREDHANIMAKLGM